MWDAIKTTFGALLSSKSIKIAIGSLVISVVVFAVILTIFGFNLVGGTAPSGPPSGARDAGLSGAFILFFMVVWFLLYVQTNREADDVYSRVRERLKGGWSVTYEASNGPARPNIFTVPLVIACEIHVNPDNKKLELVFDIQNNPVYESGKQIITSVAIRHDIGNRYDLFYYYEGRRKLRDSVGRYLVPTASSLMTDGLDVEIFGILRFEETAGRTISKLTGEWFDLNGKVTQIFALVDEVNAAVVRKETFAPVELSAVDIHLGNFSAKMGKIEFTRLGSSG